MCTMLVPDFTFKPYTVSKGACLYHVYTKCYGPLGFNASGLGFRRFDPITNANGKIVPTYYAAHSDLVALQETVVRLNDKGMHELTWRKETDSMVADGLAQGVAQVVTKRAFELVDLQSVVYGPKHDTLDSLLRQGNVAYVRLQQIAKYFVNNHPLYDGLIWDSYQRGAKGERAMVLWGHKVDSKALKSQKQDMINTAGNLERLRDALRALNVLVPEWLIK